MSEMSARQIGFIAGLVVLLGIVVICAIIKKSSLKGEYDERQELIRGRGYKYALLTVMVFNAICLIFGVEGQVPYFSWDYLTLVSIMLGTLVFGVYSIRHDAFIGLNNNVRSFVVLFAACIIANLFGGIHHLQQGLLENGQVTFATGSNLTLSVGFVILLITILVQHFSSRED
jgi:hypothetical protein